MSGDIALYRRLAREVRPYWSHLAGVLLLSLLGSPLGLLGPLPLKIAVDSAINGRPLPRFLLVLLPLQGAHSWTAALIVAIGLLIATALLSQMQSLATSLLGTYTAERLVLDFRAKLFAHVQGLSIFYHESRGTSDSIYRIQTDAQALQYITIDGLVPFASATVTVLAMMYVTVRIDWQLATVALTIAPLLLVASATYRPLLRNRSREVRSLETLALAVVQEVLSALRVVQAFGTEEHEHQRYVRRSKEGMRARIHLAFDHGRYGLLVGLTTALGTAAVLWFGIIHVKAGTLTLGSLLLVMGYLAQLYEPLKTIGRKSATLQGHLASVERAFSLLDEVPDVVESPNAKPLARVSGAITYRNVAFEYRKDDPVFQDVSFAVPAGVRVGIVGRTGAGKTTLMMLLARFCDPTGGSIELDGVDLRECKLEDLRNQFAIVLQEPILLSTSIAENIGYARPGASMEEIREAAKLAEAHEFIVGLPDGYETLVGERGMQLSGGERQRISLARAFLKDAPILILDEPTSAVDIETESDILTAAERLMRGRTTFIIAHRPNMLRHCDMLLHVQNGRATLAGSWEDRRASFYFAKRAGAVDQS